MSDLKALIEEGIGYVNEKLYKPSTALLDIRDRVIIFPYALLAVLELPENDYSATQWRNGYNHALQDVRETIERELTGR